MKNIFKKYGLLIGIIGVLIVISLYKGGDTSLPNPASVYCEEHGGILHMVDDAAGQAGICELETGERCDEWAYYRGECGRSSNTGTLTLMLKDAPNLAITSLPITISGVKVHSNSSGWVTVEDASQVFDLIELVSVETLLASQDLAPGHYNQIRLSVDYANIVLEDGTNEPLTIPSKEIKIVSPFDIVANQTLTITLDFDANQSVHQAGQKYILRPTIKAIYNNNIIGQSDSEE